MGAVREGSGARRGKPKRVHVLNFGDDLFQWGAGKKDTLDAVFEHAFGVGLRDRSATAAEKTDVRCTLAFE